MRFTKGLQVKISDAFGDCGAIARFARSTVVPALQHSGELGIAAELLRLLEKQRVSMESFNAELIRHANPPQSGKNK